VYGSNSPVVRISKQQRQTVSSSDAARNGRTVTEQRICLDRKRAFGGRISGYFDDIGAMHLLNTTKAGG
jgi:hypothetical protein